MMEGVKQRRILVPVDESEESMHALKWAVDNLQLGPSDTLILYNVKRLPVAFEGLGGPGMVVTPEVTLALEKYQERISEDVMRKAREICCGSQANVDEKSVSGDARERLCEAVTKFAVDFLVVGSRGRGTIKRALLGSVSDHCAHHATCPVLIVKKPHHHHHH